jgi:hypothetical protein
MRDKLEADRDRAAAVPSYMPPAFFLSLVDRLLSCTPSLSHALPLTGRPTSAGMLIAASGHKHYYYKQYLVG